MDLTLGFVLFETCRSICADPRDKIFSILARVPTKENELLLWPDYGISKEELNVFTATACLEEGKSLDILKYVHHESSTIHLSSRAPEWKFPPRFAMFPSSSRAPRASTNLRWDRCISQELLGFPDQSWTDTVDLLILRGGFIQQISCVSQQKPEIKITWRNYHHSNDLAPRSKIPVDSWTWALLNDDKNVFLHSHSIIAQFDLHSGSDLHSYFSYPWNDKIPGSEDHKTRVYTRQPEPNKVITQAELEHYCMFCRDHGLGRAPSSPCVSGRRIAVTINGYFVLVAQETKPGDMIVGFAGLDHHFVVRKYCKMSDGRDIYVMIGQCYVDDVFD
jgi:hypothetical protein